jgi:hypothetical protein
MIDLFLFDLERPKSPELYSSSLKSACARREKSFSPELRPHLLGLGSGPYTILIHFSMNISFNYDHTLLALLYGRSYNIRLNLIEFTVPYFPGYPVYPARRKLRQKVMRLYRICPIIVTGFSDAHYPKCTCICPIAQVPRWLPSFTAPRDWPRLVGPSCSGWCPACLTKPLTK